MDNEWEVRISISSDDSSSIIYEILNKWDKEVKQGSRAQFLDEDPFLVTSISFILGTITSGFLKQIGKEIWDNFKKIFVDSSQEKEQIPGFKVLFNYNGLKIKASLDSDNPKKIKRAFDSLNVILEQTVDIEDEFEEIEFVLDEELGEWVRV